MIKYERKMAINQKLQEKNKTKFFKDKNQYTYASKQYLHGHNNLNTKNARTWDTSLWLLHRIYQS